MSNLAIPSSTEQPITAPQILQTALQRINNDLRTLTAVGLICSIALSILFAFSSHGCFSFLSIAATGVIFRCYQEIQIALDPTTHSGSEQLNLFKLTQVKMGQLVTLIGESLAEAGKYLSA